MKFQHKKIRDDIVVLYGFRKKDIFSAVMTLSRESDETEIHGFLTKKSMTVPEFYDLWKYLKEIIETKYLIMDVLPDHARVYKMFLPYESAELNKTFDGLNCERLKIPMSGEIKPFQSV